MNNVFRGFKSDNAAGVHPDILTAIMEANHDHVSPYGADPYTDEAKRLFKEQFGASSEVFFVSNGTAANVLSLKTLLHAHQAVLCSTEAHIHQRECGATEYFTGSKLIAVPTKNGKLSVDAVQPYLSMRGDLQSPQPKVIALTQATESGQLYTAQEIKTLCDFAHQHDFYVYMDGARYANACAALQTKLSALSGDLGVDILSFGGTKNGMMYGEAVVFFKPELARYFGFTQKQGLQTLSKMRFLSAQFIAYLTAERWRKNAEHANQMASSFAQALSQIPGVSLLHTPEINLIFAYLPKDKIETLQAAYPFYVMDAEQGLARLVTSFETRKEDIAEFIDLLKR